MTSSEIAQKLLDFYDNNPNKWTSGANARNSKNEVVDFEHYSACKWCIYGACLKLGIIKYFEIRMTMKFNELLGQPPVAYNDTHTFNEVMTALERIANESSAIERS